MAKKRPMTRLRPQVMCKKHPEIPAVEGKHLCQSCIAYEKFGKATMGGGAKT